MCDIDFVFNWYRGQLWGMYYAVCFIICLEDDKQIWSMFYLIDFRIPSILQLLARHYIQADTEKTIVFFFAKIVNKSNISTFEKITIQTTLNLYLTGVFKFLIFLSHSHPAPLPFFLPFLSFCMLILVDLCCFWFSVIW